MSEDTGKRIQAMAAKMAFELVKKLGGKCSYDEFDEASRDTFWLSVTLAGFGSPMDYEQNQKVAACLLAIDSGLIRKNADNTGYEVING